MNPVAEDILRYIGCNEWDEERLAHYGMPRRSGRYPYGSGEKPYQHGKDFLSRVEELKKNGWEETPENIMKEFGLKTSQYRIEKKICNDERKLYKIARIKSLQKDGLGPTEIGKIMGINESSVRSALKDSVELNTKKARETADFLKKQNPKVLFHQSSHFIFPPSSPKSNHQYLPFLQPSLDYFPYRTSSDWSGKRIQRLPFSS